jgi:putative hydrolase of the HAD superfamily
MITEKNITTLFLDIGGVLLTNGWTRKSLHLASSRFEFDEEETDERHHLTFDTYEAGKLTLDDYLDRVVFYRKRNFTKEEFKTFMFDQSIPIEGTLEFFKELKSLHNLKVIAVNNEARELNDFRIQKYKLDELFDAFVSSCNVHLRKPDVEIFKMACDIAHTSPPNILYVDDRLMFVEVAATIGIRGYHFTELNATKTFMESIRFSGTGNCI